MRLLRWLPMMAGLIALDRVHGVKGLVFGVVAAIDVAALCVLIHNRLTRNVDRPVPDPTWFEALLVWANVSAVLVLQVALGDPGGAVGRVAAVLTGLALGALGSELVAARRAAAGSSRPAPLDARPPRPGPRARARCQKWLRRSVHGHHTANRMGRGSPLAALGTDDRRADRLRCDHGLDGGRALAGRGRRRRADLRARAQALHQGHRSPRASDHVARGTLRGRPHLLPARHAGGVRGPRRS